MGLIHWADRRVEHGLSRYLNRMGFQSAYIPTPHGMVHAYEAIGKGPLPPIVLLHGLSSGAISLARLMRALRPHFQRILVPDALGHGLSDAPETLTTTQVFEATRHVINARIDTRLFLFGNSLGGGMALKYALENPDRIHRLILTSPAGAEMEQEKFEQFVQTFQMTDLARARDFVDRLLHKSPWSARILARLVQDRFNQPAIRSLLEAAPRTAEFMTPAMLATLQPPTLLLWGCSDRIIPREHFEYYRSHLPSGTIVEELERTAHCAHLERPQKLSQRILSFTREHRVL
jgi:pimeloyl-ACP methyl ester carboxylesterase